MEEIVKTIEQNATFQYMLAGGRIQWFEHADAAAIYVAPGNKLVFTVPSTFVNDPTFGNQNCLAISWSDVQKGYWPLENPLELDQRVSTFLKSPRRTRMEVFFCWERISNKFWVYTKSITFDDADKYKQFVRERPLPAPEPEKYYRGRVLASQQTAWVGASYTIQTDWLLERARWLTTETLQAYLGKNCTSLIVQYVSFPGLYLLANRNPQKQWVVKTIGPSLDFIHDLVYLKRRNPNTKLVDKPEDVKQEVDYDQARIVVWDPSEPLISV